MPRVSDLPSLLRLADDPSETVREAVVRELAGFGDELEDLLEGLETPPGDEVRRRVLDAVALYRSEGRLEGTPRFQMGQLVVHRRYGYRGVVVACDETCQAPDEWYRRNRTQPDRDQPWYHVLVHDSSHATYAAESSLEPDDTDEGVRHPAVSRFFAAFQGGRYERNDEPWPGWDEA